MCPRLFKSSKSKVATLGKQKFGNNGKEESYDP